MAVRLLACRPACPAAMPQQQPAIKNVTIWQRLPVPLDLSNHMSNTSALDVVTENDGSLRGCLSTAQVEARQIAHQGLRQHPCQMAEVTLKPLIKLMLDIRISQSRADRRAASGRRLLDPAAHDALGQHRNSIGQRWCSWLPESLPGVDGKPHDCLLHSKRQCCTCQGWQHQPGATAELRLHL